VVVADSITYKKRASKMLNWYLFNFRLFCTLKGSICKRDFKTFVLRIILRTFSVVQESFIFTMVLAFLMLQFV